MDIADFATNAALDAATAGIQAHRNATLDRIYSIALNPDEYFAGKDLGFTKDPKKSQMMAINSAFMSFQTGSEKIPLGQSDIQRRLLRQSISKELFNGLGADSEEEFSVQITQRAQTRKDTREVYSILGQVAQKAASSMLAGKDRTDWKAAREEISNMPGYNPKMDADFMQAYQEMNSAASNAMDPFAPELKEVWQSWEESGSAGKAVDVAKELLPFASLDGRDIGDAIKSDSTRRTAYDIYSQLKTEEREPFLQALGAMAALMPKEEQPKFFANIAKQAGRDLETLVQQSAEGALNLGEGSFNDPQGGVGAIPTGDVTERRRRADFVQKVQNLRESTFDPVKKISDSYLGKLAETVAYGTTGVIATSAAASNPYTAAALFASLTESHYQSLLQSMEGEMGYEKASQFASNAAPAAAAIETASEFFGAKLLRGKLPFFDQALTKAMDGITNPIARGAVRFAAGGLESGAQEVGQNYIDSAVRGVSEAFGVETGTIIMPNAQDNIEAFASVFPLALMGIPGAAGRDIRVQTYASATDLQMKAAGYSEAGTKNIRDGIQKGLDSGAAAIDREKRDPTTPEAIAAQKELQAELQSEKETADAAKQIGVLPQFIPTQDGIRVIDGVTGEEIGLASNGEDAVRMASTRSALVDQENENQVAFLASLIEAGSAKTDESSSVTIDPFAKVTPAQEKAISEADEARVMQQTAVREALSGGERMSDIVFGKSVTEFKQRARSTANRINAGGTVLTVVHEDAHGFFREAIRDRRLTMEGTEATIRGIEAGLSEDLRFLPSPENFAALSSEEQATAIDEAVSELVELLVLKNRKSGRASPLKVSQNLSSFAKLDPRGKGFNGFVNTVRDYFGLVFSRLYQLKKGIKEGKVKESDIADFEAKLYGLNQQDELEASAVEVRNEILGSEAKSLGPAKMADVLQQDAMKRIKDPKVKAEIFRAMVKKFSELKADKDELVTAYGKTSVRKAIQDPRKRSSIDKEAAFRQADKQSSLEASGVEPAKAKKQAKEFADKWKQDRIKEEERNYSPRARLLRAFGLLDGIISTLPIELRGRVGGYTQLAKLKSDESMLKFLEERVDKVEKVTNEYLKKEFTKTLGKIVERSKTKGGSGEKARGHLGAEAHRFFKQVESAMSLTEEEASKKIKEIDEKLAEVTEETDPEDIIDLSEQWQILQNYANFSEKTVEQQDFAVRRAQEVYDTGRNKWKSTEEARLEENKQKIETAIKEAGSGSFVEVQESKASDQKIGNSLMAGKWSLKSFRETLESLFGTDSETAKYFGNAARRAFTARTKAMLEIQRSWAKAMEKATGLKGREARQMVYEMASKQTISAPITPEKKQTIKVPIATFFDAENQKSLGLTEDEIDRLTEQFENLPDKSTKKNLTLERSLIGETRIGKYTEAEAIHLSMLWAQDQYKPALRKHGFGEEFQKTIEPSLSEAGKSLRQWLGDYYRENYEPLRKLYAKMYGVDLAQIGNYAPGTFYGLGTAETAIDPSSGVASGGDFRQQFLNQRAKHTAAPRAENAFNIFFSHVNQTEHWKAMAPLSRELHGVFGNPDLKIALAGKSTNGEKSVREWISAIDANGVQMRPPSKAMQFLMTSQAYIALSWKLTTLVKNAVGATINATYNMPAGEYLRGLSRLMAGKIDFGEIWESDAIQNRLHGGFSPEMRAATSQALFSKPSLRGDLLLAGLEIHGKADAFGTAIGAAVTYDYHLRLNLENGYTESEAKALAMDAAADTVSRTSQPAEVIDRSLYELNLNSVGKLMFLFASEARQKSSMWATAWANTLTGKPTAKDIRVLVISHLVMSPLMFAVNAALRDALDDDDKEKGWTLEGVFDEKNWDPKTAMMSAILGPASGIPYVRDLESIIKGYGSSSPLGVFANAGNSLLDIIQEEPKGDEYDWYEKKVLNVLRGLSPTTGVGANVYQQVSGGIKNAVK